MGEGWGVKPGLCDTTKNFRLVVEGLGPPLRERYSQRESLARDMAPQTHKRATTEQTDNKQRRTAREALKEASETDFSKYLKNTGGDREKDGGRERERER